MITGGQPVCVGRTAYPMVQKKTILSWLGTMPPGKDGRLIAAFPQGPAHGLHSPWGARHVPPGIWDEIDRIGRHMRPRSCAPVNDQVVVEHTRRWISSFVIGLGLCPFARRVFEGGRIRYAISHARDNNTLSNDLAGELHLLLASPSTQIETTLLIHPHVLGNFLDYNDFLGIVDQLLEALRLCGTIQVASFHPHYRFSGTKP